MDKQERAPLDFTVGRFAVVPGYGHSLAVKIARIDAVTPVLIRTRYAVDDPAHTPTADRYSQVPKGTVLATFSTKEEASDLCDGIAKIDETRHQMRSEVAKFARDQVAALVAETMQ